MNAVRGLVRDLVERRLWPVVLLLVAAAVAVPVYLGRSSSDASDAPVAVATVPSGAKASRAAVRLDDTLAQGQTQGSVRNPFRQQHAPKPAADTAAPTTSGGSAATTNEAPATSTSGSSGGSAPPAGTGSTPSIGGGSGTPSPSTSTKDPNVSHVTVRLGPVGDLTTFKDVARLSALPSAAKPLFIFIGVLKDGKTAVLLPSSVIQISPQSDVSCKPSNTSCQTLELTSEDTVFFTITGDPQAVQYQLNVVSVEARSAGSTKATTAALTRHSTAGAAMLRDAHINAGVDFKSASDYRWVADRGVLVRTPQHSKAHASANGAVAASSADLAAALPGVPVWHWRSGA